MATWPSPHALAMDVGLHSLRPDKRSGCSERQNIGDANTCTCPWQIHPIIQRGKTMASKIEDYGLIGNTFTAALVSRSGSVDWLCAPRFDSDACFAAIIGYDQHGRWSLRPAATVRENRQRYRDDTMILETEFACDGGAVRIIDFMPTGGRCDVVRIIEGLEGEVPLEMLLDVRFGYGADAPFIEKSGEGMCFMSGPDAMMLRTPIALD